MSTLLHLDSSVRAEGSVSRALTARAVARWCAANPAGKVTYRDLAADPIPHLDASNGLALMTPAEHHNPAEARTYALSRKLIDEIRAADTVVLGMALYNYAAPSLVKTWVDHIVAAGLSFAPDGTGLLTGTEFVVIESRGGSYREGTPKHGWDHAESWIAQAVSLTGLEPQIIVAELTMAAADARMAHLRHLARVSLERAHAQIDALWAVESESVA
ncbi:FMN-dependent NADH-azoreductase [Mycolicibacterium confluentis]|uniref:FMN dependent NADH:quinone oxidoreductase n=1 Tax=Mycolicibacterium confluentis TaxID=28047 RepID=A0A7I7Y4A0_9MYCO|nr:NAD(P)H-dependent oxidoreductase [Mycolicibacterium confluentis]MCV7319281.1 NAD(P)H-dependent oxidoreductase [Mycolicibacterium confluentis]ORV25779.1 FMN-dependent NADH-azoreductase [Mycolicibacterium confluentis]BBZ36507.1 FMN-dependent NADH-azoreductase [Mycolicibacterium confluentis]